MTTSKERTAEFARLLQFFDQLAARGKNLDASPGRESGQPHHHHHSSSASSASEIEMITSDDVAPAVAPSTTFAKANKLLEYATHLKLTTPGHSNKRPRRSTVSDPRSSSYSSFSSSSSADGSDSDEISLAKFPLSKQRPFTFRLMLHKLYERDDWIKKVQESLEQSKKEYKPLAEHVEQVGSRKVDGHDSHKAVAATAAGGRVHFATGLGHPGSAPRHLTEGRQRSVSASLTNTLDNSLAGSARRPVKKRCIGRRKSLSGPLNAEVDRIGNAWVYDALVSQLEHEQQLYESAEHRLEGKNRSPSSLYPEQGKRSRRRISLGETEGKSVGIGATSMIPVETLRGTRKRALTTMSSNIIEDIGRAGLKRPFAI